MLNQVASACRSVSLVLAGCLPFLVPFDGVRDIDLQGFCLVISGGFAWVSLLLGYRQNLRLVGRSVGGLLGIFALCCLVSSLANPHLGNNLLGAPDVRLGTAGLLACVGIGLVLVDVPRQRLLMVLYAIILGAAVVSVPYSWHQSHSLWRLGGVPAQADVFACFVGCGLLLGLEMLGSYPRRRKALLAGQGFWIVLLVLSETRAVLLLVIILGLVWVTRQPSSGRLRRSALYVIAALILVGGLHYLVPNRLTNAGYASESVHYRLTLQAQALRASQAKPVWGYGPGNLADALSCSRLSAPVLRTTCHQGYFFNSSHDIFIDRALMIGWLGGLSYLAIIVLAVYRGLGRGREAPVIGYAVVLIGCYYLTNVTSLTLELLLWILALSCLALPKPAMRPH